MLSAVRSILLIPQIQPSFIARLVTGLFASANGSGTPTFTRATTAYQEDFEGKHNLGLSGEARFQGARRVRNLLTFTETFSNAAWAKTNAGSTSPTLTGTTQFSIGAIDAAGDYSVVNQQIVSTVGIAYRGSIDVKAHGAADVGKTLHIYIYDGAVTSLVSYVLTASYKRISPNVRTATTIGVQLVFGAVGTTFGGIAAQDAFDIDVRYPQLENVTGQANQNPSEYVSVGVLSAPFHGANVDGVQYFDTLNGNTVASNVVTEATGAKIVTGASGVVATAPVDAYGPFGYLAEGARTNRALYSQTWENAAWVATNVTKADNSAVAPDGTSTAATLTASAGNGTVIQDLGVVASASKTGGLWIKRKTGTGDIELTMDGGTGWTAVTVTAAWTRVSKNQTLADEDFGIRIVTSGDAVYVWNAQVETAAFLSTDIPTTTAAVTRNADVLVYGAAGNASDTAGSAYAEILSAWSSAPGSLAYIIGTNNSGRILTSNSASTTVSVFDGTNGPNNATGTSYQNAVQKAASYWGTGGIKSFLSGNASSGASYDGGMTLSGNSFGVGNDNSSANQWFGTIRNVGLWPAAKKTTYLQNATLPGPVPF